MDQKPLLVDEYCPIHDFTRVEYQLVEASAPAALESLRSLDLAGIHSPLTDLATAIRELPERLKRQPLEAPPTMRLADLFDAPDQSELPGWVALKEDRGHELVFGAIGKFWQPQISWWTIPAEDFEAFGEPGWGKIVASVVSHPYGERRSILSYEARTVLYDEDSRKRFGRYWKLISPFAGVVMRSALRAVADTQRADPGPALAQP